MAKRTKQSQNLISIEMSVLDRISIRHLFPEKATLNRQILLRDIAVKTDLMQAEMTVIDFKVTAETGKCTWNNKAAKNKVVGFTIAEISYLKELVKALDEREGITAALLNICALIKEA